MSDFAEKEGMSALNLKTKVISGFTTAIDPKNANSSSTV